MENDLEIVNEFANLTFIYGGKIAFTSEQIKRYQEAVRNIVKKNEELDEKNFGYTTKIALLEAEIIENEKDKKKNYIPKVKVLNELKKLDKDGFWDFLYERDLVKCCEILRGLIEEGDDK